MANVYPISKFAEIDLTNAIGAKLAVFVVASDGAVKELVSDLPLSIGTGITVNASGLIVYDGTSSAIMSTELLSPLSDISFYARVKYNVSTVDQAVFGINTTATYPLLTAWADTSGGKLRSRIWASAGGYGPNDGLPANTWLNWGGKANAAANLATTFVSGLPTVIDSNIGSRAWETENTIYIGSSGSTRPINGEKQYFAYFSEELTDAEFLSFNDDPWQVLKDAAPSGGVTGDISFEVSPVEFSASGSATLPAPSGDIAFDIGSVEFSVSGSATLPQPSGDISFDIPSVIFSGEASATLSYPSGDISFSVEPVEFSIEASATLPSPACDIDFTVPAVEFSCTGAASLPQPQCAISFSVDSVEFSATGGATMPRPSGDIEFTVEPVEFIVHGTTAGTISNITLPVGSLITPKATSNIITLPKTSNLIKL